LAAKPTASLRHVSRFHCLPAAAGFIPPPKHFDQKSMLSYIYSEMFTLRAMSPAVTRTYDEKTHLHNYLFRLSKVPKLPIYQHIALPILPNGRDNRPAGEPFFFAGRPRFAANS
jgi:hypothetical protein